MINLILAFASSCFHRQSKDSFGCYNWVFLLRIVGLANAMNESCVPWLIYLGLRPSMSSSAIRIAAPMLSLCYNLYTSMAAAYLGVAVPLTVVRFCDSSLATLLFLLRRLLPSATIIGSLPRPTCTLAGRLLLLDVCIETGPPLLLIPRLARCFFSMAAVS